MFFLLLYYIVYVKQTSSSERRFFYVSTQKPHFFVCRIRRGKKSATGLTATKKTAQSVCGIKKEYFPHTDVSIESAVGRRGTLYAKKRKKLTKRVYFIDYFKENHYNITVRPYVRRNMTSTRKTGP